MTMKIAICYLFIGLFALIACGVLVLLEANKWKLKRISGYYILFVISCLLGAVGTNMLLRL